MVDLPHGGVDDAGYLRGPARKLGAIRAVDQGFLRLGDARAAPIKTVRLEPEKLAGGQCDEPDLRVFDGPRPDLPPDRHQNDGGLLCGEAVKGGCRPPTYIRFLDGRSGDSKRVVLANALHPPLGRQQHVAASPEAGKPALAHEVADDLAPGVLGVEKAHDVAGLGDIPALLAERQDDPGFRRPEAP